MSITLFKYKKGYPRLGCAVVVLVLSMTGWLFMPASAEDECATDFFSQKTCRSFDAQESVSGVALWKDYSRLSGNQIWHRDPFDGGWKSMAPRSREVLTNQAIHGFRCLTDLFGNVFCNRDQMASEVPFDKKLPSQR
jgi:hypothetical protein